MDAMGRLAACAADAVGRNPKEGWQDSLIRACDDVEEKYEELLAMAERLGETATICRDCEWNMLNHELIQLLTSLESEAKEAIAKAKGGE